jgi:hypothetical protein
MKKVTFLLFFIYVNIVSAQVGIGTNTPAASAELDVTSTQRGLLPPRMSQSQRNLIASPATGLLVFQTDNTAGYYFYNGSIWEMIGAMGPQGPSGLLSSGTTAGNTPYWDGTQWVVGTSNIFNNGGNIGIGTATPSVKLEVNGRIKTLAINELSDVRYKKDILTLTNSLANVEKLRGVTYNWKQAEFPQKNFEAKHQIGLIAQELEKVYPELVNTDEEGYKSVDYSKLVAVLIEAVKEQQVEIKSLQVDLQVKSNEMDRLDTKVKAQNTEIIDLKDSVLNLYQLFNDLNSVKTAEKNR